MPTITVDGRSLQVDGGTRRVLAIEGLGIAIGHRCGGIARCTTCRVSFVGGEPEPYTRAEFRKLRDSGLLNEARLSCQVLVEHDTELRVHMTKQSEGWSDTGPVVAPELTPDRARFDRFVLIGEERPD